jgi:hypothetical protein
MKIKNYYLAIWTAVLCGCFFSCQEDSKLNESEVNTKTASRVDGGSSETDCQSIPCFRDCKGDYFGTFVGRKTSTTLKGNFIIDSGAHGDCPATLIVWTLYRNGVQVGSQGNITMFPISIPAAIVGPKPPLAPDWGVLEVKIDYGLNDTDPVYLTVVP